MEVGRTRFSKNQTRFFQKPTRTGEKPTRFPAKRVVFFGVRGVILRPEPGKLAASPTDAACGGAATVGTAFRCRPGRQHEAAGTPGSACVPARWFWHPAKTNFLWRGHSLQRTQAPGCPEKKVRRGKMPRPTRRMRALPCARPAPPNYFALQQKNPLTLCAPLP